MAFQTLIVTSKDANKIRQLTSNYVLNITLKIAMSQHFTLTLKI